VHQGNLTEKDGVPRDVVADIKNLGLSKQSNFTAYPEGSPLHPSWPAMHSAGSSASMWLPVVLNLTKKQLCEAMLLDYAVAFGRTVAGVHYYDDNMAGLKLGQGILSKKLPDHLANRFGSNKENVEKKIEQVRFDWDDFDYVNGCH